MKTEVSAVQPMTEKHFSAEDVGVAYDATHVWVCINGISIFRAKIYQGKFFAGFDNLELNPPKESN